MRGKDTISSRDSSSKALSIAWCSLEFCFVAAPFNTPPRNAQSVLLPDDALSLLVHQPDGTVLLDDENPHEKAVEREGGLVERLDGTPPGRLEDFLPGLLGAADGARPHTRHLVEARRDGGEKDLVVDRLDQIVVDASLLSHKNVVPLRQGREKDEGNIRFVALIADRLEHVVAPQAGHGDVAENEIGSFGLEKPERLEAVRGLKHPVTGGFQFFSQVGPQVILVLNAKDRFLLVHDLVHLCSLLRLIDIRQRQVECE